MPNSATEPLNDCAEYTIPNTVYVNDLVHSLTFVWWIQWRKVEMEMLTADGYNAVLVYDTTSTDFLNQLSSSKTHGVVVIAHGDENHRGDFSESGPGYVKPDEAAAALHHRLAGFKAIWCWGGVKRDGWNSLISPTGYLFTDPGKVFFYQAWPGFIHHSF